MEEKLRAADQSRLLDHWTKLSPSGRSDLEKDLANVDFAQLKAIFHKSIIPALDTSSSSTVATVPVTNVAAICDRSDSETQKWRSAGLDAIRGGKVGVILLAGGQGTRLGSSAPKGCYDIGLPSKKSLFQLQAERLLKVQQLAAEAGNGSSSAPVIWWYIMTSPFTDGPTKQHFADLNYFGLRKDQIVFFRQGTLPCLDRSGQLILETETSLARAPDGNGGVYLALRASGFLDHMESRGVQFLDCYCVDNALVRVADPLFIGHCIAQGRPVGARVVQKGYPEERVGVFAHIGDGGGAVSVVEYSELAPAVASAVDADTGELLYKWSNVCMHFYEVVFLRSVTAALERDANYHVAFKKIPSVDGPVEGCKLEQFIFDAFPYAGSSGVTLMEVSRQEEFSPVKNAPGSKNDSPDSARLQTLKLHTGWVLAAGGEVVPTANDHRELVDVEVEDLVEVSPLLSYAGEGLESYCRDKSFVSGSELWP